MFLRDRALGDSQRALSISNCFRIPFLQWKSTKHIIVFDSWNIWSSKLSGTPKLSSWPPRARFWGSPGGAPKHSKCWETDFGFFRGSHFKFMRTPLEQRGNTNPSKISLGPVLQSFHGFVRIFRRKLHYFGSFSALFCWLFLCIGRSLGVCFRSPKHVPPYTSKDLGLSLASMANGVAQDQDPNQAWVPLCLYRSS